MLPGRKLLKTHFRLTGLTFSLCGYTCLYFAVITNCDGLEFACRWIVFVCIKLMYNIAGFSFCF